MLVLSRRRGEKLRLKLPDGSVVWLKVLDIRPRHEPQVRLGIEAPAGVVIEREEIVGREIAR